MNLYGGSLRMSKLLLSMTSPYCTRFLKCSRKLFEIETPSPWSFNVKHDGRSHRSSDNSRLTTMQVLHVPSVCRSRQNFSHRCFGWYFFENSKKARIHIRWPWSLVRKKTKYEFSKTRKCFFVFENSYFTVPIRNGLTGRNNGNVTPLASWPR